LEYLLPCITIIIIDPFSSIVLCSNFVRVYSFNFFPCALLSFTLAGLSISLLTPLFPLLPRRIHSTNLTWTWNANLLLPSQIGKLVNIARTMGLDIDPDLTPGRYGLYESEARRRAWWDVWWWDV
jgi:hypothetical protein